MKRDLKAESIDFNELLQEHLKDENFKHGFYQEMMKLKIIYTFTMLRLERNLTQKDLARLMKTKQANISRFENGLVNPTLETIERLATALNVDVDFVIRDKQTG